MEIWRCSQGEFRLDFAQWWELFSVLPYSSWKHSLNSSHIVSNCPLEPSLAKRWEPILEDIAFNWGRACTPTLCLFWKFGSSTTAQPHSARHCGYRWSPSKGNCPQQGPASSISRQARFPSTSKCSPWEFSHEHSPPTSNRIAAPQSGWRIWKLSVLSWRGVCLLWNPSWKLKKGVTLRVVDSPTQSDYSWNASQQKMHNLPCFSISLGSSSVRLSSQCRNPPILKKCWYFHLSPRLQLIAGIFFCPECLRGVIGLLSLDCDIPHLNFEQWHLQCPKLAL